ILAALHTANFILTAAIAAYILPLPRVGPLSFIPPLLAAAGFLGWNSLYLLGSYHHDNVVSIFFLISLLVMCRQAEAAPSTLGRTLAWQAAAGLSAGLGLGLKLTLVPYVVAIGCAPLFYRWPFWRRLQAMAACACGGLVGFLAVAGFHM